MPVGEHMHSSGNEVWINLAMPVGEHRHSAVNAVSSQFCLFYLWLFFSWCTVEVAGVVREALLRIFLVYRC
jgi:hypothetical protein